ncbi:hypothetical protein [Hanstruepera neustonica]|nr:hypothetical protein [Hanstruepera neustonica]
MTAFFKFRYLLNWKIITGVLLIFATMQVYSQVPPPPPCLANGNNGFGGAVGEGVFSSATGNTNPIVFGMQVHPDSGSMDDILVFYIDTGAPGRNAIDNTVDDNGDVYRIAITNSDSFGFGSHITFPPGFEASYAVAVDVNFGGLYAIPASGTISTNDLEFVSTVNSTLTSPTQLYYEFSFSWEAIGLTSGDEFEIVGLYVRNNGFSSDEAYGEGVSAGTSGSDDITFIDSITLPGCGETLSNNSNEDEALDLYYVNNQLFLKGINDLVSISVYDIHGRNIYQKEHEVNDVTPIHLELNKNQLQFIVVESSKAKKVLKVIPN